MLPIETIETKEAQDVIDNQLNTLHMRIVDNFSRDVLEAQRDGFGYIAIDKLERALFAIASLQGLDNIVSIDDVISGLADNKAISDESLDALTGNFDEVREVLMASSEVLTLVPGQRSLAQRALELAQNFNESGITEVTNTTERST